jgi:MinD-like ATPase involved in chromosome partitioning or flagellar assembly
MAYTRVIGILSGKGGVGKTTIAFNLGAAMADQGKNVVLVDGNMTTPNLGIHAGLPLYPITLHDVLRGKVDIYEVMHLLPNGLKIVPASISVSDLEGVDPKFLGSHLRDLLGKVDYVIIDGAPGLGGEALGVLRASDQVLGVATPDLPALTNLLKSIHMVKDSQREYLGTIINMHRNKSYEPKQEHIESMLEDTPILETIPHDENIRYSLSKRIPVVHYKPNAYSSLKIKRLAGKITGNEFKIEWYRKYLSKMDFKR